MKELKNTTAKVKNLPDCINTLDTAEEKISEREQTVQISNTEAQRSWLKNYAKYLTDIWKILRGQIHVIGFIKGERPEIIFEKIMIRSFMNLIKAINPQIQETQPTLISIGINKTTTRHIFSNY